MDKSGNDRRDRKKKSHMPILDWVLEIVEAVIEIVVEVFD